MYKVEVDKTNKIIKTEVSGFVKIDEVNQLHSELQKAIMQFSPKEAMFIANMADYKPASPEVLPVMQKIQELVATSGKKVAVIHASAISQMQLKRVGEEAHVNDKITRFKSEEEALKYLLG